MALPTTGEISLNGVNLELRKTTASIITLNDSVVRTLFNVPSGQISLDNGHGKSYDYPAQVLTYDGQNLTSSGRVYLSGGTAFNVSIDGSTTFNGGRISQLHIVCWGAGGGGATWPNVAAGGYGGAGYRISINRATGAAQAALLDSLTSLQGQAGNSGTPYGSPMADNRQAGGAGGTSYLNFNGSTRLITAKGGHGARAIWTNPDSNFIYATNSGSVGDNGGSGAPEGGTGGAATYGGGGGGSNGGSGGSSTYGGAGGIPSSRNGKPPAGGGCGIDSNSNPIGAGGIGRVIVYVNTPSPF